VQHEALAGGGAGDAFQAEHARVMHDLLSHWVGDAGAKRSLNDMLAIGFKQSDPVAGNAPPGGGLGYGVAEQFSGQALALLRAERTFEKIERETFEVGERVQAEGVGVGQQAGGLGVNARRPGVGARPHNQTVNG